MNVTKSLVLLPAVFEQLGPALQTVVGLYGGQGGRGHGAHSAQVRQEAAYIAGWLLDYFNDLYYPLTGPAHLTIPVKHKGVTIAPVTPREDRVVDGSGNGSRSGATGDTRPSLIFEENAPLELLRAGLLRDVSPKAKLCFLKGLDLVSVLVEDRLQPTSGPDSRAEAALFWSWLAQELREALFEGSLLDSVDFQILLENSGLSWMVVTQNGLVVETDPYTEENYGFLPVLLDQDGNVEELPDSGLHLDQLLSGPPLPETGQASLFPDTPASEAEGFLRTVFHDGPWEAVGMEVYFWCRTHNRGVRHQVVGCGVAPSAPGSRGEQVAKVLLQYTDEASGEENVHQLFCGLSRALHLTPDLPGLVTLFLDRITRPLHTVGALLWLYHGEEQILKPHRATGVLKTRFHEFKPQVVTFGGQSTFFHQSVPGPGGEPASPVGDGAGLGVFLPRFSSPTQLRSPYFWSGNDTPVDWQSRSIMGGESLWHRWDDDSSHWDQDQDPPSFYLNDLPLDDDDDGAEDGAEDDYYRTALDVLSVPLIFEGRPQGVLDLCFLPVDLDSPPGREWLSDPELPIDVLTVELVAAEFAGVLAKGRRLAHLEEAEQAHQAARFHLVRAVKDATLSSLSTAVSHRISGAANALDRLGRLALSGTGNGGVPGFTPLQWEQFHQTAHDLLELGRRLERELPWDRGQLSPVCMGMVVDGVRAHIGEFARSRRVRVVWPGPGQGRYLVYGNRDALEQVVLALLVNGVEAVHAWGGREPARSGAGEGHVHVSLVNNGPMVELVVEDWGVGVREGDEEMLFKPFYSTRDSIAPDHDSGSVPPTVGNQGLGLTIARGILHRHGGAIRFERPSPEHNGCVSRFVVSLPGKDVPSA